MPRRKAAIKRKVTLDPLYESEVVTKFINVVMRAGKKSIAEKIVYQALSSLTERIQKEKTSEGESKSSSAKKGHHEKEKSKRQPHYDRKMDDLDNLRDALNNVKPTVEVKPRRVGGATYQVPIEVAPDRGIALAMRWVVKSAKTRSETRMALRLAAELYDAYMGRGASIRLRDNVHSAAKANLAFVHYRW